MVITMQVEGITRETGKREENAGGPSGPILDWQEGGGREMRAALSTRGL